MKVSQAYKQLARQKIVDAAGRGFREKGYGGLGVDGLAKEAGVTSGAFYGHFKSKDEAFEAATIQGLIDYRDGVKKFQADYAEKWLEAFLDYYLGEMHLQDIACGCALPGLTVDVIRSGSATKSAYETILQEIAKAIADGLPDQNINTAYALMSLLSGSVNMMRAVNDRLLADTLAKAARSAAESVIYQIK
jgi:TetR/AcrR family transcriptional regulator, transcriptional repressor for nem operon